MKVGEEQLEAQHTGDWSDVGCGRSWTLVDCLCPPAVQLRLGSAERQLEQLQSRADGKRVNHVTGDVSW